MNTPSKPDYGEPWLPVTDYKSTTDIQLDGSSLTLWLTVGSKHQPRQLASRIVACVNAFAGVPDPAAELARLRQIEKQIKSFDGAPAKHDAPIPAEVDPFCCIKARCKDWEVFSFRLSVQCAELQARLRKLDWTPVTERLPTLEDANEFEDVEWSDGKDIWQGNYQCAHARSATHWRAITLP